MTDKMEFEEQKMEFEEQKMELEQIKQAGQSSNTITAVPAFVDTLPSKETAGVSPAASTLSNGENSETGDGKSKKNKKKKGKDTPTEPVKAVGYFELYRFATPKEYFYIA